MERDEEESNVLKEDDDDADESSIFVLYVSRAHAKKIKTLLESQNVLHKGYRMTPATTSTTTSTTTTTTTCTNATDVAIASYHNAIAIPIQNNNHEDNVVHQFSNQRQQQQQRQEDYWLSIEGVLGTGYQKCPPSSSRLGNHHHHHPNISNIAARTSSTFCQSSRSGNSNSCRGLSLVEQCLYAAAKSMIHQQQQLQLQPSLSSQEERRTVMTMMMLVESIQRLQPFVCPRRLETLGDDRTIVIPQRAFAFFRNSDKDPSKHFDNENSNVDVVGGVFETWFQDHVLTSRRQASSANAANAATPTARTSCQEESEFLQELWKQLAMKHNSPRIVRKGGVDPNSRIRHSGYQILWPLPLPLPPPTLCSDSSEDPDTATSAITTTAISGPNSPGWITVTEQGIRQSFDLTRVMFSRGNITEKIRFGQTLVQAGEAVLDLYAGIGYFTLPALIHGQASRVVACEWNAHAVQALKFNLKDNGILVDDDSNRRGRSRVVVLQGDCRQLAKEHHLVDQFDRVSLGLLPSSEGGWRTAVQALRRDMGGWLHIHGNVPVHEVHHWARWLCHRLATFVMDMRQDKRAMHHTPSVPLQPAAEAVAAATSAAAASTITWVVICTHIEKVKSFAPTVNHYVADVFVGPVERFGTIICNHNGSLVDEMFDSFVPTTGVTAGVLHPDGSMEKVVDEPSPPSCALSPEGVLCQDWMRET
jgi:tRNA G37 N-methylase Trm5